MSEPVVINVEPLSEAAFAPFGKILSLPAAAPTGHGRNYQFWAGLAELPRGNVSMGMVQGLWDKEPIDAMEGHTEQEMLICVEKPQVIVVCKPGNIDDAKAQPKAREARAFLMKPGQGVLFGRGTWHYVPMALEGAGLSIFVVNPGMKGRGNTDEHWVKFARNGKLVVKK